MPFWKAHRTLLLLGLILVAGFGLRVAWITDIDPSAYPRSIPTGGSSDPLLLGYDGVRYHAVAMNLITRGVFGHHPGVPDSWRPPGYPFFLSACYLVFGPDVLTARLIQALMGCGLALLLFWLTRRLSGSEGAGLLAAAFYAFNYDAVLMTSMLYSELLSALVVTGAIALLVAAADRPAKSQWLGVVIAHALVGYAALIRPGNLFFLPVTLLYGALIAGRGRRFRPVAIGLAAFLTVVCPWMLRNSMLHHKPATLSSHGGLVLFISHHPESRGTFVPEHLRYTDDQARALSQPGLDAIDKDRIHYGFAFDSIRELPGRFFVRMFQKQWLLWTHLETRGFFFSFLDGIRMPLMTFNFLAALGLAGMVANARQIRRYLLIYGQVLFYCAMISLIYYYHGPRTRIELLPALSVFAAAGLTHLLGTIQRRSRN